MASPRIGDRPCDGPSSGDILGRGGLGAKEPEIGSKGRRHLMAGREDGCFSELLEDLSHSVLCQVLPQHVKVHVSFELAGRSGTTGIRRCAVCSGIV